MQTKPFQVILDSIFVAGIIFALTGCCDGEQSTKTRRTLLTGLSVSMPKTWNVDPRILNFTERGRESDPADFQEVHCTFGLLKRAVPQGYSTFTSKIQGYDLSPLSFTIDSISLVNARYNSYAFPQQGMVTFKLGEELAIDEKTAQKTMNFA